MNNSKTILYFTLIIKVIFPDQELLLNKLTWKGSNSCKQIMLPDVNWNLLGENVTSSGFKI